MQLVHGSNSKMPALVTWEREAEPSDLHYCCNDNSIKNTPSSLSFLQALLIINMKNADLSLKRYSLSQTD